MQIAPNINELKYNNSFIPKTKRHSNVSASLEASLFFISKALDSEYDSFKNQLVYERLQREANTTYVSDYDYGYE